MTSVCYIDEIVDLALDRQDVEGFPPFLKIKGYNRFSEYQINHLASIFLAHKFSIVDLSNRCISRNDIEKLLRSLLWQKDNLAIIRFTSTVTKDWSRASRVKRNYESMPPGLIEYYRAMFPDSLLCF